MPEEGTINGRYRLIEVIGQGAMGTVWRGHDEMLDREVAIKKILLPSDLNEQDRAELKALAMQEARATARLNHPGVITLFDVIEHDGAPVIVMELLEGESLAELLRQQVRLPWRRVAEIGAAMVDALKEAHAAEIIHRDLKPANVLISGRRIVITDFGIAQRVGERTAADPDEVTGTPAFMAPEQAENAAASPAADLWSLGATLFNAVEGRPPFEGPDYASVLLLLLTQDPPEPRRAGPLRPLITSLLHKNPALRPTTDEVAEQLEALLHEDGKLSALVSKPVSPPPASPVPPTVPPPVPSGPLPATGATTAATNATASTPTMNTPLAPRTRSAVRWRWRVAVSFGALVLVACLIPVIGHRSGSAPTGGSDRVGNLIGPLAFSPDGRTLAVAENPLEANSFVELLDVRTHKRLGTLTSVFLPELLAFSPDGSKLAAGDGDGSVVLWSVGTRTTIATTSTVSSGGFFNQMTGLEFGKTGNTVFTCDDQGRYGKWAIGHAKPAITMIPGGVNICIALSPTGTALATYDPGDQLLTLWQNFTGRRTATNLSGAWPSRTATVASAAFSPDGKTFAVARYDSGSVTKESGPGTVELWDLASHMRLATHDVTLYKDAHLAFSSDSTTLAVVTAGGGVTLLKLGVYGSGTTITSPFTDGTEELALSGDAGLLAAGGFDGQIRLWDLKTHRQLATWS